MANQLFAAAQKAADWMLDNQVTDRLDANRGRTISAYSAINDEAILTTSWRTAAALMAFLAMHKRTGEEKYLHAAELAGRYIMSLQVLDQRREKYYGIIRECTPQSIELCPRDAATAAWGMVWLYEATHNEEYLDCAVRYAEWHLKFAMYEGWPKWSVFMDEENTRHYAGGSFQSGTGLFYHDLFLQTGDTRYIEFGLKPIAQNYVKNYLKPDGSIIQERRIFTNELSDRPGNNNGKDIEVNIHNFNDDFGNQMLWAAADLFKDESYREAAHKFALWLARHQSPEGGWHNKIHQEIHSATPIALMYFDELGKFYQDAELLAARDKTLAHLLSMQILDTDNAKLYGAFESTPDHRRDDDPHRATNIRTNSYAVIALLKLEGQIHNFWLGGALNDGFVDPLDTLSTQPYHFKW